MDSEIREYCKHIQKAQINVLRYDKKKGVWYWDLPAAASICHNLNYKLHQHGYSHKPAGTKWKGVLANKLSRLGKIGEHSKLGRGNIIGNCAEQHAGNNYMNYYNEKKLNSLYFSETVRPRTMEILPPCDNCQFIFPNLYL